RSLASTVVELCQLDVAGPEAGTALLADVSPLGAGAGVENARRGKPASDRLSPVERGATATRDGGAGCGAAAVGAVADGADAVLPPLAAGAATPTSRETSLRAASAALRSFSLRPSLSQTALVRSAMACAG